MAEEFFFQRIADTVTPIFDEARGRRLKYMRMLMLLDQAELGERLGINQQLVSGLENGKLKTPRNPFTLSKLYSVFGCVTHHILFGLDRFDYNEIARKYWREKDKRKGNRTARIPKKRKRR